MPDAPPQPDSTATRSPLLRLENVSKTFHMGEVDVNVLHGLTLDLLEGEFMVMVGPSGSGKTTILNIMGGLDTASSGNVWYRGRDLSQFNAKELTRFRREAIGFVFQFYNLVPNLTARENVMVATELTKTPLDVDETLRLVGLEERMNHFPSQLSGGEQQRVAIARALAKNPELLLCDEPTGALDAETGKHVLELLLKLQLELGKTILIITHNSAIAPVADRVARLRSGRVVEVTTNAVRARPEEIEW